ncbi:MAG: HAMP domain-containing sensor histidine kinase [Actinomycetota bacterium]
MSRPGSPSKPLRSRLFFSHLVVMAVALAVLAIVVAIVVWAGEGRALDLRRGDRGSPVALLLGLAAAVIASAAVSWRISRRLTKPIERIGGAARSLASGRYDVRVPGADTTELDALAADVNTLARELATTEERRLRLIGDVAHELRNPLSTIEGTMEGLLDRVVPGDDDTYARVGREAARLRRLADDLSSLSAAGEFTVSAAEPVDLVAVARHVVAQLEPQAVAKGLSMGVGSTAVRPVIGDRDRLTQVVTNVVGNAVQYTDEGRVEVRVRESAGSVIVEVADSGRGLATEDQERVFERFHRVDAEFTDGTGVGLAIAELIVKAHGGRIRATSAGLGAGTTVSIEIPSQGRR